MGNSEAVTSAPPYPPHWDFDVVLADGGTVHVRPILPTDADTYLRFFHRLSRETRYYRFFSPKSELSDDEVRYFTTVDFVDRMALVALAGDEIIAVARYDRLTDGPQPDAEVAFTVDDAHQGRGLGTLMLEYLAAAGRENGVGRFVAQTMPDNRRMIDVFHDAGYQTVDRFADGLIEVEFPIAATDAAREAVERREHRAEARSIDRILNPKSVAVIGASSEPGTIGQRLFLNLLAGGFSGPVYPVNPNAAHVASVPAYPTVADVPGEIDLAVIATPAEVVPSVVDQCTEKGVKGLVVISAGFAEEGPAGADLELEVLEAARRGGIRVVGPNCMGVANSAAGLNATFVREPVRPGRIGVLSESGAVGMALLDRAGQQGLGISSFASIGNKVDVSGNDLLQYWEDDPGTDVVLLYLESFGNPRKFARIARRVSKKKPIVAVKSGRGSGVVPRGGTGGPAAPDVAVDALFHQAGVIRVGTLDELFDVAAVLSLQPLPAGRRVAVVTNARGPGLLAADAAADAGLEPAALSDATRDRLRVRFGEHAAVEERVELPILARPPDYAEAVAAVLADGAADAVHVVVTPPLTGDEEAIASAIRAAAAGSSTTVVVTYLSAAPVPAGFSGGGDGALPTFDSPEPAALALGRVARYADWRRRDPGEVPEPAGLDRSAAEAVVEDALAGTDGPVTLDAGATAALLAAYGIEATDPPSPEHGAVTASLGVVQHRAFGPLVTFGIGGVPAELLADRAFRILPITDADARELVRSLRASPLLFGYEGGAPLAVDALVDLIVRIGLLADECPDVAALRMEPVIVGADGVVPGRPEVVLQRFGTGAPELVRRLRT